MIQFPEQLSIKVEPESILRKKAIPMSTALLRTQAAKDFFQKLQTLMLASDGIGIAAPQVGVSMRVCIVSDNGKKHQVLINPEITWMSRETIAATEGCLSVPHLFGEVVRSKSVHVKALDADGKKIKIKAKGMLSRVIQHEIDHLDGILFIDKAQNIYKSETENLKI